MAFVNRIAVIILIVSAAAFVALLVFGVFWTTNGNKDLLDLGGNWDIRVSGKRISISLSRLISVEGGATIPQSEHSFQLLGLSVSASTYPVGEGYTVNDNPSVLGETSLKILVPIWQVVMLHALLIGAICYLQLKRKRLRQAQSHSCAKCGYLLIGNTSGVCPECGETTVKSPSRDVSSSN